MLETTSTERRAAGGDRPRSGGSVKMRQSQCGRLIFPRLMRRFQAGRGENAPRSVPRDPANDAKNL